MLNLALVGLLAVLQASTPPQNELTGQPCTARELVGTWEFTAKSATPGVTSVLKHITPTHFFVARIAANDVVLSGLGGTYSFADGTYTETLKHGFGAPLEEMEKHRGVSVAFQCRLNGEVLHLVGQLRERKIDEQWRRVSGTSNQR